MKFKLLTIVFLLLFATFANAAPAAKNKAKSANAVTSAYFSADLPPGWFMPEKISEKPRAISAVFANKPTGMAITVNVLLVPVPAKDLAEQTIKKMNASGLNTGKPQKVGSLYKVPLTGKANGEAWFGSNGQICAATVILGKKMDAKVANEFFAAFRPKDPELFPARLR